MVCECQTITRYGDSHQCMLGDCRRAFYSDEEVAHLMNEIHDLKDLLQEYRRSTRTSELSARCLIDSARDVGIGLENLG